MYGLQRNYLNYTRHCADFLNIHKGDKKYIINEFSLDVIILYFTICLCLPHLARMEYQEALKIANERKREKMEERLAK